MTERRIIITDVETNGLYVGRHSCVEVAWWDLLTDERGCFIPIHDVSAVLAAADVKALQLNRYIDRIADQPQDTGGYEIARLAKVLHENSLAGSNPGFDAAFLSIEFAAAEARGICDVPQWHHRKWDLSVYAAAVLGLRELPGLATVCELLGIETCPDHTAETDVTATGLCFRELFNRVGVTP